MDERRPIAEFECCDTPDFVIVVGDYHGSKAPVGVDPDFGGWVDLTDPANPIELEFTPTWFEVTDQPASRQQAAARAAPPRVE